MQAKDRSEFYDNSQGLPSDRAVNIMKYYFVTHLPSFKFISEYNDPHGYWGAYFSDDEVTIFIGEERSFLAYSIEEKEKKIALSNFDERVTLLERTSKTNLLFLLDIIERNLQ